ncbi:MAG: 30S ribosomal protein S12 methylthiotransferase RimO, partial [Lachnospiraceae bacterium]|nr:30S ribosomal protein S12 methylthiotransferase RimO [Lachnospiraceae bacterium]
NTILEMAELKKTAHLKYLIAAGCLAERYKDEMLEEIEELDAIVGTASYADIADALEACTKGLRPRVMRDIDSKPVYAKRIVTTVNHFAYLKIAEGCDKHCTYCIIPSLRGRYRSIPMEDLTADAERLAANGVKELILIAQETTVYGKDIYGKKMLPELLKRLCAVDGIEWIRVLYCYPEEITDELIEVMAAEPKICKYIDMPLQHASDRILRAMGRRTDKNEIYGIIEKLRDKMPDIAIRTTLITGFPGETEADHEELLDLVADIGFDRLGAFEYSAEEGTKAAEMPDQVDAETMHRRYEEIMALQQAIAFEKAEELVGTEDDVIIDGYLPDDDIYVGRTYRDAPEIDGYIFVRCDYELMGGDIVRVRITDAREYDLIGEIL